MKKTKLMFGSILLSVVGFTNAAQDSLNNSLSNENKLIYSHSRTPEQNASHQKFCQQLGGIDITDDQDIKIGSNTLDAIFCKINDENKFKKTIPYVTSGIVSNSGNIEPSNKAEDNVVEALSKFTAAGTFQAIAANGTVKMYQPWYCTGTGVFNNVNAQSSIKEEAPNFGCSASNSAFVGSGTLTATIMCGASQGTPSTYNYATACAGGCVQDRGTVYFSK